MNDQKFGGQASRFATYSVGNVAPSDMQILMPVGVTEGQQGRLVGSFADPGLQESPNVTLSWSDGLNEQVTATRDSQTGRYLFESTRLFANWGIYSVDVTAVDKDGASVQGRADVAVANAAPVVSDVVVTTSRSTPGLALISGQIRDDGTADAHSLTIDWADGRGPVQVNVDPFTRQFSASNLYGPGFENAAYTVRITATDRAGETGIAERTVTFRQADPTVTIISVERSIVEDGVFTLKGRVDDADLNDTHTVSVDFGDGSLPTVVQLNPADRTFAVTHRYLDDAYTQEYSDDFYRVVVTVEDQTGRIASQALDVTVINAPPTLGGITVTPVTNEGGTVILTGIVGDAGSLDEHDLTVNWGDGRSDVVRILPSNRSFTLSHVYLDDALGAGLATDRYTISVSAMDDWGDEATRILTNAVEVRNVAPTFGTVALSGTITEGGTARVTGDLADLGLNDTHILTVDWGDGSAPERAVLAIGQTTFELTHVYGQDSLGQSAGAYAVKLSLADNGSLLASATPVLLQTVSNAAPEITALSASKSVIDQGEAVTIRGRVADTGALDALRVSLAFGDGTTQQITASQIQSDAQGKFFEVTKTYNAGGVFRLAATVHDEAASSAPRSIDISVNASTVSLTGLSINGVTAKPAGQPGSANPTVTLPSSAAC